MDEHGWYVFNDDNEISCGPFETREEAMKAGEYDDDQRVGYGVGSFNGYFNEQTGGI